MDIRPGVIILTALQHGYIERTIFFPDLPEMISITRIPTDKQRIAIQVENNGGPETADPF
ncbi:hypothetical protein [Chitinophaga eiseniae]|uniref:hypothetical protein n=1 Tax=Chitinophaga eiseniae TaxID=634771 RepID=UPI00135644F1|nr:hypothetical protein [Chitinophaga eiseniae]